MDNNHNCASKEEYLEELISRVLEQHEVSSKEEVEQISSCVLPLVTKIMEYIDGPEEEPIVDPIVDPIVEETQVFVYEPVEVFDPKELLEPFTPLKEEILIIKEEQLKEEPVQDIIDVEQPAVIVVDAPFRFTTWLQEMWEKVKK